MLERITVLGAGWKPAMESPRMLAFFACVCWRLEAQAASGAGEIAGVRGEGLALGEEGIEPCFCGCLYPKSRPLRFTSVSPCIKHGQGIPILARCQHLERVSVWFLAVGIIASGEGCHSL